MENLAGLDERLKKLAGLSPFLYREKKLKELRLVLVVRVLLKRFTQRKMLGLALGR